MLGTKYLSQNITDNATTPLDLWSSYYFTCGGKSVGVIVSMSAKMLFCLFGFPACIMVLWVLLERHRKGASITPHDFYMLNITIIDLLYFSFLPPSIVNWTTWQNQVFEGVMAYVYSFSLSGRPLFTSCICLDCYLAVLHPIWYRARKSLVPRVLMSGVVWMATFAYGTAFFLDWTMVNNPVCCWPYALTLPIVAFCDFSIIRALRKSDPGGRELHPQKRKARQIIVNSLVTAVIAYLPAMLGYAFVPVIPVSNVTFKCTIAIPVMTIMVLDNTIMPILYLENLGKLDSLKRRCCKRL